MLRTCRPSDRTCLVGSSSFSSTSACTPCSRNSQASINPVGPPPAMMTSNMTLPHFATVVFEAGRSARAHESALRNFRRLRLRPEILQHYPGLAARPLVRYRLEVARSERLLAVLMCTAGADAGRRVRSYVGEKHGHETAGA